MSTKRKPRCFIAMAFGKKDTDTIYDKHIKSIVKNCGFAPRRIDRVIHNDFIDRKIINEIENADVCIADLTYARQSVYFEAGFAQRKIPVIYTCRQDHFINKDDFLMVHFDLRQRNIIPWNNVSDRVFPIALKKRLTNITRPIITRYKVDDAVEREKKSFGKLSFTKNAKALQKNILTVFRKNAFKHKNISFEFVGFFRTEPSPKEYLFFKKVGTTLIIARPHILQKITKKLLERRKFKLFGTYSISKYIDAVPSEYKKRINLVRYLELFFTLNRINRTSTVRSVLGNYSQPVLDNHYTEDSPQGIAISTKREASLSREFAFIDDIKSITQAKNQLGLLLEATDQLSDNL